MSDEVRLPEGRSGTTVWRSNQGVHPTTGPWTATVHAFLRHLEWLHENLDSLVSKID